MELESLSELTQELSNDAQEEDLNNVKLPYVIPNHTLMSPGVWNGYSYPKETITQAFNETHWNKNNQSLFYEHSDKDSRDWVGDIKNFKTEEGTLLGDIYIVDKQLAMKLAYGAKFGVSPKIVGEATPNKIVKNAVFDNFSIVLNPACKTTFLNSEIKNIGEEEMNEEKETVKVETKNNELAELKSLIGSLAEKVESLSQKTEELSQKKEVPVIEAKNEEVAVKSDENKELAELMTSIKKDLEELKTARETIVKTEENTEAESKPAPVKDVESSLEDEDATDLSEVKNETGSNRSSDFLKMEPTDIGMAEYLFERWGKSEARK